MTYTMTRKETLAVIKAFSSSVIARNRRLSKAMLEEINDTITAVMYRMGYILNEDYCFVAGGWNQDKNAYVTSSALPVEMQEEISFDSMETRISFFIRYVLYGGKEQ